jgi:hypothetical protein
MKKILFFTVAMSLMITSAGLANDMTKRLGLGFVSSDAPVGGRYMFSEKAGLDVGLGLSVDDEGDESFTDWTIMFGVPINLHRVGDRVNFNFLPAFQYTSIDNGDGVDSSSLMVILALLEFEVFVTADFSVGASHGLAFDIFSPPVGDSETDISLVGFNVTNFGFHYYLPGGE